MSEVTLNKDDLEKALLKSQGDLMKGNDKLEASIEKMQGEIGESKSASAETKSAVEALAEKAAEITDRCVALEQRGADDMEEYTESLGSQFVKSEAYLAARERGQGYARMESKTAIINTFPASSVQPLVQGDRLGGINAVPNRRLTLKDLLPNAPTSSNLVEFTRENALISLPMAA